MSATREAWSWLQAELDRWGENNLRADFWWRDDDAVSANTQLERLLRLSASHSVPLALAVIPARLESSLGGRTARPQGRLIDIAARILPPEPRRTRRA